MAAESGAYNPLNSAEFEGADRMYRIQNKLAWVLLTMVTLVLVATLAGVVRGGPLDPQGPVAPTGKTVITSLPYNITQPGSYVLNSNLTGVGGQDGIAVNAANVTIDLQGFELRGVSGSPSGIVILADNVEVRNGTIRDWHDFGVWAGLSELVVDDVRFFGNGGGVWAGGRASVRDCQVTGPATFPVTPQAGITVGDSSTVVNCVSENNGAGGIYAPGKANVITNTTVRNNVGVEILAGAGTTLENCTADGNSTTGNGIEVGDDSVVRGCTATNNGGDGILAGFATTIEDCISAGNTGDGIEVGHNGIVRGCTARNNGATEILGGQNVLFESCVADGWGTAGWGISASSGSVIDCRAKNNLDHEIYVAGDAKIENCGADGAGTPGRGIWVGQNSVIHGCVAINNGDVEIFADDRSIVEDSVADGWTGAARGPGDGILVLHNTIVRGCTAQNNAGAGIHVTTPDNRIEGNHVIGNTVAGIKVDSGGNVIINNSASGSVPNYSVVAGNQYETAGPVAGDTNPWANIEY
jgi:parallel beta-helix repeat protein